MCCAPPSLNGGGGVAIDKEAAASQGRAYRQISRRKSFDFVRRKTAVNEECSEQ
jgi:hypothetical protein